MLESIQQRNELFRSIWKIADELRGAIDGWDFKQYVFGILFYRYLSENITLFINKHEHESGRENFDYVKCNDNEIVNELKNHLIDVKGIFIYPSELFCNVVNNNNGNINEILEKIFRNIEATAKGRQSEENFVGLFKNLNVNSQILGNSVDERNKKLVKILKTIKNMPFSNEKSEIDIFGDAYEYLMAMYASNAGKSGGEYFTPPEVSELLVRLAINGRNNIKSIYDPACGSGSLLLKIKKILKSENCNNIKYFGQEKNITTYNLCRMNMLLHDINYSDFHIKHGDTLLNPEIKFISTKDFDINKGVDVIVSNPPYSIKWEGDDNVTLINEPWFQPAGVLAPKSKADLAFIMHALYFLNSTGTAAIVCFPGILYRGGAEQKIRKYLIDNNFIDAIIQLPEDLFFGTSISTSIMVLKKNKDNKNILFIDASNEFVKVTNNNKLTSENIENIVKLYNDRIDKQSYAKIVSYDEIKNNNYNISVSSYVIVEEKTEKIDINKLNLEIKETVAKINELRSKIDQIIEDKIE